MFVCSHCQHHFANKYSLERHVRRIHDSWVPENETDDKNEEVKEDESESESESDADKSEDDDTESDEAEDSARYTLNDLGNILRVGIQLLETMDKM